MASDDGVLAGEVAIVTGASRGIGRAVALELASGGCAVVVNFKDSRQAAEATVAEIVERGGEALAWQADVVDETAVARMVEVTSRRFGRIDILVCNAGMVRDRLAGAMTLDDWEAVMNTNLRGSFLCIRAVVAQMMAQKSGSIVALSSIAAERGGRGHCNYAAAKAGINGMVRSLAIELAPKKIRVNAVAPGVIVTDMSRRVRNAAGAEILAQIPLARYGEPHEVAKAVRFLASRDASYITGEIVAVTGGMGV